MKRSRVAFVDLEMTGLDYNNDSIIEVACFVVESDLSPVEGAELCLAVMPDDPTAFEKMDQWNKDTHGPKGSNLVRRCLEEGVSTEEAEDRVMELLREHMEEGAIFAGNSVWNDMNFVRASWPRVAEFCTFRIIDVSSFKEVFRRIAPNGPRFRKNSDHTALADAKGSLEELRFYIDHFMRIDLG